MTVETGGVIHWLRYSERRVRFGGGQQQSPCLLWKRDCRRFCCSYSGSVPHLSAVFFLLFLATLSTRSFLCPFGLKACSRNYRKTTQYQEKIDVSCVSWRVTIRLRSPRRFWVLFLLTYWPSLSHQKVLGRLPLVHHITQVQYWSPWSVNCFLTSCLKVSWVRSISM